MRTHVGKVLVGPGFTVGTPAVDQVAVAPWADIQALLNSGTALPAAAPSDEFGFVRRQADISGTERYITEGPFKSATSIVDQNPYTADTQQVSTVTVDVTDLVDGAVYILKVLYHDNLSIIPNQMKFTTVSVVFTSGMTAAQFAIAIAAEFNKQDQIFVSVTAAASIITFTGLILSTASKYNRIDRPEMVVFEIGIGDMTYGSYPTGAFTTTTTTPVVLGQGSAEKIAWMEDRAQGRRGYSDRTQWNDGKRFVPDAVAGATYDAIVVTDSRLVEGDMQNTRSNPIGAIVAVTSGTGTSFIDGINTIIAPNVVNVIEHPIDS